MRVPRSAGHRFPHIAAPQPRRLSALPVPNFDVAPFVPLPSSPQSAHATRHAELRAYYNLPAEEDVSDADTVQDNSVDGSFWDSADYDTEDASVAHVQTTFLSHDSFASGTTGGSFSDGYSLEEPVARTGELPLSDLNDLGECFSPQPTPVLATASPHTFLGTPPPALAGAIHYDPTPTTPQPREYQWATLPDSGGSQFTPGRPEASPFERIGELAPDSDVSCLRRL